MTYTVKYRKTDEQNDIQKDRQIGKKGDAGEQAEQTYRDIQPMTSYNLVLLRSLVEFLPSTIFSSL